MKSPIKPIAVEVYTKPNCPACTATERALTDAGIPYQTKRAQDYRDLLTKRPGAKMAPVVVVYIDDKYAWHWQGYSPDMINQLTKIIEEARPRDVDYDDVAALRELLIGQTITNITQEKNELDEEYSALRLDHIYFTLSNGAVLEAIETDGGCSCSNGCWSVDTEAVVGATIMAVDIEEVDPDTGKPLGDEYYESAVIRLFVMTDAGRMNLVVSEGHDNGYYGWGFHLRFHPRRIGDRGGDSQ